jgi:hypothetical protein
VDGARASNPDGLEVLGAEDAAMSARMVGFARADEGVGDEVLAGRSDAGDMGFLSHDPADGGLSVEGALAPEMAGVLDRHLVVLDSDPDGIGRPALHDEGVVAGVLELRAPVAAEMAVGHRAVGVQGGQRRDVRSA